MSPDPVSLNPFPFEAAVNLESIAFRAEEVKQVVLPPTCPLPHVLELRKVCRDYLGRIPTREKRQGRCYLVQGDNGSGKTHALGYVLVRIASGYLAKSASAEDHPAENAPPAPRDPVVLYAKVREENSSLVTIQRELLGRLAAEEWRDLGRDAMSKLATRRQASEGDLVQRLMGELIIDRGTLWRTQAQAMKPGGTRTDLSLGFSYFLGAELGRDPTLTAVARAWLAGQEVSEADQRKLGVQGPLTTEDDAAQALLFLSTLCGLADRPMVLVIDQIEKLVFQPDGKPSLELLGLLNSLVETVPVENTLLLLAGTSRAWEAFPAELRRRVENNIIRCDRLSELAARNVIATYLNPTVSREADWNARNDELGPFGPEATRCLLSRAGGSIRRLLQLASKAYEKAAGGDVDPAMIDEIAQRSDVFRNDRVSARLAIESALRQRGLSYSARFKLSGSVADFAVLGRDGRPRLLMAISESIFVVDEVSRAVELSQLARAASQLPSPPVLLLVVAGYASMEVVSELTKVPYQVCLYDPETFTGVLGALLDTMEITATEFAVTSGVSTDSHLSERLDRIDTTLAALAQQRAPVQKALEAGLEEEGRRQLAPRLSRRRLEARRDWTVERTRLEEAIHQMREKRNGAEIEELRRLRDKGEAARREASDVWSAVLGLAAIIGLVLSIMLYSRWSSLVELDRQDILKRVAAMGSTNSSDNTYNIAREYSRHYYPHDGGTVVIFSTGFELSILLLAVAFMRFLAVRHLLVSLAQRNLSKPVENLAELDALAMAYLDRFKRRSPRFLLHGSFLPRLLRSLVVIWPRPRSIGDLLRDPSPHFRYAAVLALAEWPELAEIYFRDLPWMRNVQQEQSSLLKRKFASMIGTRGPSAAHEELLTRGDLVVQAYCLAARIETSKEELNLLSRKFPGSKPLQILHLLLLAEKRGSPGALSEMMSLLLGTGGDMGPLVKGYVTGLQDSELSVLDRLTETQLIEGSKLVSPLLPGGLGSLDQITVIDRIDALFLLYRQLLFYKARGDLLTISETPPPMA